MSNAMRSEELVARAGSIFRVLAWIYIALGVGVVLWTVAHPTPRPESRALPSRHTVVNIIVYDAKEVDKVVKAVQKGLPALEGTRELK